MKSFDLEQLIEINPKVDGKAVRDFAKSEKKKGKESGALPSPYGSGLRQRHANEWLKDQPRSKFARNG